MHNYNNYLRSYKGYTPRTCALYIKYAMELKDNDLDYKKLLIKYKDNSNNTKRIILSAFRNYYKFLNDERMNEIELPKKSKRVTDYISYDEYQKIIKYLESKNNINYKKILTFRLLFETGIRSSELLSIKKENIDDDKILIYGKNNKERIVYVSDDLSNLINKVIKLDKSSNSLLFTFGYKSLYKKIKLIGLKVLNKILSPHMFRRGFATYCINKNIGIYDLSLMMGHENINTTQGYIRAENRVKGMKNIF